MNKQSADQLAYNIKAELLYLNNERAKLVELRNHCLERGAGPGVVASFGESIEAKNCKIAFIEQLCQGVDLFS